VEGEISAPVQTGPGAYPPSCRMGTGSFPGAKQLGRGVDHPPPSSAEVKERVELYLPSPAWAFLPGTSLEPAVIPTTQASSFTLQYFPYYV